MISETMTTPLVSQNNMSFVYYYLSSQSLCPFLETSLIVHFPGDMYELETVCAEGFITFEGPGACSPRIFLKSWLLYMQFYALRGSNFPDQGHFSMTCFQSKCKFSLAKIKSLTLKKEHLPPDSWQPSPAKKGFV